MAMALASSMAIILAHAYNSGNNGHYACKVDHQQ
jgi:hypothetical protein